MSTWFESVKEQLRDKLDGAQQHTKASTPEEDGDVYTRVKWNGWGAYDKVIEVDPENSAVVRHVSGGVQRKIIPFVNEITGEEDPLKPLTPTPSLSMEQAMAMLPKPLVNNAFMTQIQAALPEDQVKVDGEARLTHIMGKNYRDLWRMRRGMIDRAPDAVVLPHSHDDCVALMAAAQSHNVVIIPYGGGTNVVGSIEPNPFEKTRMVVSVDLRRMNKMLSIDPESQTAVFQTGVLGPHLDDQIGQHGFMFGHDPDSYLHSTLGGWIGARSSGAMSNKYGDIEQMVLAMKLVTPTGVVETRVQSRPAGPDMNGLIIGSEGLFGIVTEATIKIELIPPVKHYEGWLFPSFAEGVRCFQKVTRNGIVPTAMRLYDADETKLSFSMKIDEGPLKELVSAGVKQWIQKVKNYDLDQVCLCIMGYEGSSKQVNFVRSQVKPIFKEVKAFPLGAGAGQNWQYKKYDLPYLRDFALANNAWADVFETTTVYSQVLNLHQAVKLAVQAEWEAAGKQGIIGCHVAHQYKTGCCLYFTYLGLQEDENDFELFLKTKRAATEAMLEHKGTLSHHHGIGYEMVPWVERFFGTPILQWLFALKKEIDPKDICNPGKLLPLAPKPGETAEELSARRQKFQMFDKMALPSQRSKL